MKALRKRDTDLFHMGQAYGEAVRRMFFESRTLIGLMRHGIPYRVPEHGIHVTAARRLYRAARRVLVLRDLIRRAAADDRVNG